LGGAGIIGRQKKKKRGQQPEGIPKTKCAEQTPWIGEVAKVPTDTNLKMFERVKRGTKKHPGEGCFRGEQEWQKNRGTERDRRAGEKSGKVHQKTKPWGNRKW